jgi:hypothetical protein
MVDASSRPLPAFIIIGEMKCGSTALYEYLMSHSGIARPIQKEIHYYSHYFCRGLRWYKSHFPTTHEIAAGAVSGEASPSYLFHPKAPERLAETAPDTRVIALLRNPVERAYSHYAYERNRGTEPLDSFEDALAAEARRMERPSLAERSHNRSSRRIYSYLGRGNYAKHLNRWLEFFSQDQILVLNSEDLRRVPAATVRRVLDWLGLQTPADFETPFHEKNVGTYREPIDPATQEYLRRYFEEKNEALYRLVGQRFAW